MAKQRQGDQLGPTFISSEHLPVAMNDREGGERGSGISMLIARQDDDIYIYIYKPIYIYIHMCVIQF